MNHNNDNVTVIIRTINRPTLVNAIESATREFNKVIVVADAIDLDFNKLPSGVKYLRSGQKYGKYGNACINIGAYSCETEYFCLLDDDDEFIPGAGDKMRARIYESPDVDIWIPGLLFNNGMRLCESSTLRLVPGNVAVPTYKTKLLFELPFYAYLESNPDYVDFDHVFRLSQMGFKVDWYGDLLYLVRPKLQGTNGRGK